MRDTIEMAREAGFVEYELEDHTSSGYDVRYERLVKLARADEREACAKVCEQMPTHVDRHNAVTQASAKDCAAAIQRRNQMNDRELLEFAAKAAGYELDWDVPPKSPPWVITGRGEERGPTHQFSPLKDDGDALRLAVKLEIDYKVRCGATWVDWYVGERSVYLHHEEHGNDANAATRRAIVRAAAEIGKEQP